MGATGGRRTGPQPGELVSLAERVGSLGAVRAGFVLVSLVFVLLAPGTVEAAPPELIVGSGAYLLLLFAPWAVARGSRRVAQWIVAATLLADGAFLAWIAFATGGVQSPLRFLAAVHVVAVTLLASYRTGLKLAAWHSLLYFVVLYAESAAILPVREVADEVLPGNADFGTAAMLQVSALWVVALVTAFCSAVNERELRAQKADLEGLGDMVRAMDGRAGPSEVPEILLESLCDVFGFSRGVVLASREGDLAVMAGRGAAEPLELPAGLDAVVERAWDRRGSELVRELDPRTDPRLGALLPGARDVLVVPLLVGQGFRLGVVALEHPTRRHHIKRWVVALVERYASHAALTLHTAWLREQLEQKLEENRALQQQLLAQNLELEVKVQERTQDLTESLRNLRVVDEQRQRLLARLVHAEEEERQRLAGDIHDDPIQKMVAASMRLQLLRKATSDPAQLDELEKLLGAVRGSIKSLRHLIFELRPHVLDEEGLGAAIEEYLESLEGEFEHRVEDQLSRQPPEELRVVLYRLSQEALANVRRHARAEQVDVLLAEHDGGFLVRISDDGVGFTSTGRLRSARGHLGLTSMRERAEMAGGWCRLESLPGEGTTVEFWVPAAVQAPSEDGDEDAGATVIPITASTG
jgi:signal transduction histidine kinase